MDRDSKILLLVESDDENLTIITDMLQADSVCHRFDIRIVKSLRDGIEKASEEEADIIILDLSLPDSDGIDSFRRLRDSCITPIIVITKTDDVQTGLEAIKEGAQDFLVFGQFTAQTLCRSIMYAMERHMRKSAEASLGVVKTVLSGMRKEINKLKNEMKECRGIVSQTLGESV